MFKRSITFKGLDGTDITEDFYFHLSEAEIVELQVSEQEGFGETLQKIAKEGDQKKLVEYFKRIILLSYGERGADNRRFRKSDEIRDDFVSTDAYSKLFMELATNETSAAEFVNGVFPQDMAERLDALEVKAPTTTTELPTAPPVLEEGEKKKKKKPTEMSREELLEAMKEKNQS